LSVTKFFRQKKQQTLQKNIARMKCMHHDSVCVQ
jgi:hypothetical protein